MYLLVGLRAFVHLFDYVDFVPCEHLFVISCLDALVACLRGGPMRGTPHPAGLVARVAGQVTEECEC